MADYRYHYGTRGSNALNENIVRRESETTPRRKKQIRTLPRTRVDVISLSYVITVAVACIFILACSVMYIHMKTDVVNLSKRTIALTAELEDAKQVNQDLQNQIDASANLEEIYKVATTKLEMVEADQDQVIYYTPVDSEYVRQEEDIPHE